MTRWILALALITPVEPGPVDGLVEAPGLAGWTRIGGEVGNWRSEEGEIVCRGQGKDWLAWNRDHADFVVALEYRLHPGGNSGLLLRAPRRGDPSRDGLEIQLLDDDAPVYRQLQPWQYTGSVYGVIAARRGASKKAGDWNRLTVKAEGSRITVTLNGQTVVDDDLARHPEARPRHPGIDRSRGAIGLQSHGEPVRFRNLTIRELPRRHEDGGSPRSVGPPGRAGHPAGR